METPSTEAASLASPYPLVLPKCDKVLFHFNKGHLEEPTLPMWVLKAKGKSHYIHHLDSEIKWSTRETPDALTKGAIMFRNCRVEIDQEGNARIS